MESIKKYFVLLVLVFTFLSIIFIFLTAVRFFDAENFKAFNNYYVFYAKYDVDKNLVYEGENG